MCRSSPMRLPPRQRSLGRAEGKFTCSDLRAAARAGRRRSLQSLDRVAVIPPTIEPADQLLHAEPELEHVQRPFGRTVTADPDAVRHDQSALIEEHRRRRAHRSMRDIDGAWNVAFPVRLRGSCIYNKNHVAIVQEKYGETRIVRLSLWHLQRNASERSSARSKRRDPARCSLVMNGRPKNTDGRSSGVSVAKFHTPSRSEPPFRVTETDGN